MHEIAGQTSPISLLMSHVHYMTEALDKETQELSQLPGNASYCASLEWSKILIATQDKPYVAQEERKRTLVTLTLDNSLIRVMHAQIPSNEHTRYIKQQLKAALKGDNLNA